MAWIYYIIALAYIGESLHNRGYTKLAILCVAPLTLCGLAMVALGVATFFESMTEVISLFPQQPFFFPINVIVAVLRGMTCGFIRINMLQ